VDAHGAAVMIAPARYAEQVRETPQNVCRWPTMAIRDLTMVVADSALAADPLFHLGPGGHIGRSARVLGEVAAGRHRPRFVANGQHTGRVERDANLATLYPGGRTSCRDDWDGILGRHRPGIPL